MIQFPRSIQIASEIASEFKAGQALLNMQRDVRGNVARYGPGPSSQPGPVLPTTSQNSDTAAFLGAVNKVIFDQRQGGAARIGPALGNQGRMTAPSSTTSVVPAYPSNYLRPSQQQQAARDITDVHTHGVSPSLLRGNKVEMIAKDLWLVVCGSFHAPALAPAPHSTPISLEILVHCFLS